MPTTSITFASVAQAVLPVVCGVPESALNGVSSKYIVKITAILGTSLKQQATIAGSSLGGNGGASEFTIYGFLQDKIVLNAVSNWEGITQNIPGEDIFKAADTVTQGFLGRTLITPLSTRRKWGGSDPIGIKMKLKFEAFDDPVREVIQPCIGLQGLTLPRGGLLNMFGLIPPGPNPFDLSPTGEPQTERGENISLDIGGGFLKFDSVIVKDVVVTFENRMSSAGPIGAEVDLTIETYQMLTREQLLASVGSSIAVLANAPSLGSVPTANFTGLAGSGGSL